MIAALVAAPPTGSNSGGALRLLSDTNKGRCQSFATLTFRPSTSRQRFQTATVTQERCRLQGFLYRKARERREEPLKTEEKDSEDSALLTVTGDLPREEETTRELRKVGFARADDVVAHLMLSYSILAVV